MKSSFSTFFLRKNNRKTPNKSRKTFHPFPHRGSRRPGLLQIFHEANWQLILQRALATRGGAATATGPDGSDTPMGWSAWNSQLAQRLFHQLSWCLTDDLRKGYYNGTLMVFLWDSKGISIRCQWDFNSSTDLNGTIWDQNHQKRLQLQSPIATLADIANIC